MMLLAKRSRFRSKLNAVLNQALKFIAPEVEIRAWNSIMRCFCQPGIKISCECENRAARMSVRTPHGQTESFPSLHGANTAAQIRGDFFPGVQEFRLCNSSH